jgi:hypothetical protein
MSALGGKLISSSPTLSKGPHEVVYDDLRVGPRWWNGALFTEPPENSIVNRNLPRFIALMSPCVPVQSIYGPRLASHGFCRAGLPIITGSKRCNPSLVYMTRRQLSWTYAAQQRLPCQARPKRHRRPFAETLVALS